MLPYLPGITADSDSIGWYFDTFSFFLSVNYHISISSLFDVNHRREMVHVRGCSIIAWADLALLQTPPSHIVIAWYLNNIFWFAYILHTRKHKFDSSQHLLIRICWIQYHIECWLLWRNILRSKMRHNNLGLSCANQLSWGQINTS